MDEFPGQIQPLIRSQPGRPCWIDRCRTIPLPIIMAISCYVWEVCTRAISSRKRRYGCFSCLHSNMTSRSSSLSCADPWAKIPRYDGQTALAWCKQRKTGGSKPICTCQKDPARSRIPQHGTGVLVGTLYKTRRNNNVAVGGRILVTSL
jgi:hypothetical protein